MGKQITSKTAHSYYTTLRTALNEAVRERLIESNPWYKLEMTEKIKVPESKRDFLTIEEIKKMIATPFFNEQVRQAYLFSCFADFVSVTYGNCVGVTFPYQAGNGSCR